MISVGRQISLRGAGIGNEIFPWAKAHLGARLFGGSVVSPAWAMNPYQYRDDLGGDLRSSIRYLSAAFLLPAEEMSAERYERTGIVDYTGALRATFGRGTRRIRHTSGMTGGYLAIRGARSFLKSSLFRSPDCQDAISAIRTAQQHGPVIGVHLRRGDFDTETIPSPGVFNTALPISWYLGCVSGLIAQIGRSATVVVASDSNEAARDFAELIGYETMRPAKTAIGDLAALTHCDHVIPSISSFSMLALFLGTATYSWPTEHLVVKDRSMSIWGQESGLAEYATRRHARLEADQPSHPRGTPVRVGDAPSARAIGTRSIWPASSDLIYYGAVPAP